MSDDTEWDGIAKYRWADADDGKAIFDATDEIHDELQGLVDEWREEATSGPQNLRQPWQDRLEDCADELAEVLENG